MNMAMNSPDLRHLHSGGTIGNLVVNAVARFGDQPALADGKVRWSYREFGDTMGRFISLFRSLGLKKGSALSILASNRAEAWAAICAALVMGCATRRCIRWRRRTITPLLSKTPRSIF
jgi:fatty-acyl-CoA synthase